MLEKSKCLGVPKQRKILHLGGSSPGHHITAALVLLGKSHFLRRSGVWSAQSIASGTHSQGIKQSGDVMVIRIYM